MSSIDDIFGHMDARRSKQPKDDGGASHDRVVLETVRLLRPLLVRLNIRDISSPFVTFEHQLAPDSYVDLAISDHTHLRVLFEIKGPAEPQVASAWTRQTRRYRELANDLRKLSAPQVSCFLVVAHDLGDIQQQYLKAARVPVVDLRALEPSGD